MTPCAIKAIRNAEETLSRIQAKKSGEVADLTIIRKGESMEAAVKAIAKSDTNTLKLRSDIAASGQAIAEASVKEIRQLGIADEATLLRWGQQMTALFPNVKPGDHITGHYRAEGAQFHFNDRPLGSIDDPAFARAFFAIWLDPKTSAPDLRAALLKRPDA